MVAGYNERLDGLQAAFLRVKLQHLDGWNRARQQAARAYRESLPADLGLLPDHPTERCVYHLFPVRSRERDALAARLRVAKVHTGIHYAPPLHEQPALAGVVSAGRDCVEATAWAHEELSLPIFESMRKEEVEYVAAACVR